MRQTLTKQVEVLKDSNTYLLQRIQTLEIDIRVLKAENLLLKDFYNINYKQGIPSLIKALRVSIQSLNRSKL